MTEKGSNNPSNQWGELKERLRRGKLTQEDISQLEKLVSDAEKVSNMESTSTETIQGRKVVARLPFGLDVVK